MWLYKNKRTRTGTCTNTSTRIPCSYGRKKALCSVFVCVEDDAWPVSGNLPKSTRHDVATYHWFPSLRVSSLFSRKRTRFGVLCLRPRLRLLPVAVLQFEHCVSISVSGFVSIGTPECAVAHNMFPDRLEIPLRLVRHFHVQDRWCGTVFPGRPYRHYEPRPQRW